MSNMKNCDCVENSDEETSGDDVNEIDNKSYKLAYEKTNWQNKDNSNNVIISVKPLKDKEVIPIAREWMAFMAHIPHADALEIAKDLA